MSEGRNRSALRAERNQRSFGGQPRDTTPTLTALAPQYPGCALGGDGYIEVRCPLPRSGVRTLVRRDTDVSFHRREEFASTTRALSARATHALCGRLRDRPRRLRQHPHRRR